MQPRDILPVLYDLSLTIGSELKLHAMLTRTLQRLLYHTSYSAGFVSLEVPACSLDESAVEVAIAAAVGDFHLVSRVGQHIGLPCRMVCSSDGCGWAAEEIAAPVPDIDARYHHFLRLPLDGNSVVVLLAVQRPDSALDLPRVLQPVMAQLARAIVLCRSNDAHIAAAEERQREMQLSLQQLEGQYRSLVELSPIGVAFSCDGTLLETNQECLRMFGHPATESLSGRSILDFLAPREHPLIAARIARRARGETVEEQYQTVGRRHDGSEFPLLVLTRRVETAEGARTFTFFIDLSEQKRNEQALFQANETLRSVLETAPLRIYWKDRALRYQGCNSAFAQDVGLERPEALIGRDDSELPWRDEAARYREDDLGIIESGKARLNVEAAHIARDGQEVWLRASKVPMRNAQGEVVGLLGVYDDVTERKRAESHIHRLAFYDTLTGLPNRRLMHDRLQHAQSASARSRRYGAVCLLDLDDFKVVNDTKGHAVGDELLRQVAKRLLGSVREGDTVARLGGDEFVVILEGLSERAAEAAAQAESVAEKMLFRLREPVELPGLQARVASSIGIVTFLAHETPPDDLLKFADTAMYQAKSAGRDTVRFYDPQLQAELESRMRLEEALLHAVEREELALHLQPQVDGSGRVVGAEALLRWQHPQFGMVPPNHFIPLAEANGLILPIGDWVLQTACACLGDWQREPALRGLVLAINVSAKQMRQPDFVATVRAALQRHGVPPQCLEIELTESTVLEDVSGTIARMAELKALGVSFSLDDFGTGYSSLQYLKQLPLDQIKIDRSFVRDIASDPNDAAIVQTIIAMAEVLGLDVIAEGVETETQREFLDLRGCRHFQGYLFGKPMPRAEFEFACKG